MNPGGPKSGSESSTDSSVSDIDAIALETNKLLDQANENRFGIRKQEALKALVCCKLCDVFSEVLTILVQTLRRDGHTCPLTGVEFRPFNTRGIKPHLTQVIPNSVHDKVSHGSSESLFTDSVIWI
jgi:hypothetical protein